MRNGAAHIPVIAGRLVE